MKTNDSMSLTSGVPSLFQIAAFFEDFFPHGGWRQSSRALERLPIAEFMSNPDKLMKVLKREPVENEPVNVTASVAATQPAAPAKQPAARGAAARKQSEPGAGKPNGSGGSPKSPNSTRRVEFTLESPSAGSVKLAGDFTEWDKAPLEMLHSGKGVWTTVVPLLPGVYSYRFIVDGQWCDDPHSNQQIPNPYGGANAVIQVT